jgi:hypothetical protein
MEIIEFRGSINRLTDDNNVYEPTQEFIDRYTYGFSATDEHGNRVDPSFIRAKTDGSLVIINVPPDQGNK